jgi:hypothetical protein
MSHTLPDYTTKYRLSRFFANIDDAELAVRLGSPVTMDRRGSVVWMDDMNSVQNKWNVDYSVGTGWTGLSHHTANHGDASMLVRTPNNANAIVSISKYMNSIKGERIGLELSWCSADDVPRIGLCYFQYDGTNYTQGALWFYTLTDVLYVQDDVPALVPIANNVGWQEEVHSWYTMKVVMDLTKGKYVRAMINNDEYDISSINLTKAAIVNPDWLAIFIYVSKVAATSHDVYLDDFILTTDEP